MIDRNAIARSARFADAEVEEIGMEAWADRWDVSVNGLLYVAEQRALRSAMLRDGHDPRKMPQTQIVRVRLSPESQREMPFLQATWIDGFACGLRTARDEAS